jgi:hypothetical protein
MGNLPFLTGSRIAMPHGWIALVDVWAELNALYLHGPSRPLFLSCRELKVLREVELPDGWGVQSQIPIDTVGIVSAAMWHLLRNVDRVAVLCCEATAKRLEPDVIRPLTSGTMADEGAELTHIPENHYVSFQDGRLKNGEDAGCYVLLDAHQLNEAAINARLRISRDRDSRDRQAQQRIWTRLAEDYLRDFGTAGITKASLKEIIAPGAGTRLWSRVWDSLAHEFPELSIGGRPKKTATPKKP